MSLIISGPDAAITKLREWFPKEKTQSAISSVVNKILGEKERMEITIGTKPIIIEKSQTSISSLINALVAESLLPAKTENFKEAEENLLEVIVTMGKLEKTFSIEESNSASTALKRLQLIWEGMLLKPTTLTSLEEVQTYTTLLKNKIEILSEIVQKPGFGFCQRFEDISAILKVFLKAYESVKEASSTLSEVSLDEAIGSSEDSHQPELLKELFEKTPVNTSRLEMYLKGLLPQKEIKALEEPPEIDMTKEATKATQTKKSQFVALRVLSGASYLVMGATLYALSRTNNDMPGTKFIQGVMFHNIAIGFAEVVAPIFPENWKGYFGKFVPVLFSACGSYLIGSSLPTVVGQSIASTAGIVITDGTRELLNKTLPSKDQLGELGFLRSTVCTEMASLAAGIGTAYLLEGPCTKAIKTASSWQTRSVAQISPLPCDPSLSQVSGRHEAVSHEFGEAYVQASPSAQKDMRAAVTTKPPSAIEVPDIEPQAVIHTDKINPDVGAAAAASAQKINSLAEPGFWTKAAKTFTYLTSKSFSIWTFRIKSGEQTL